MKYLMYLVFILLLCQCANMEIPDFEACPVELPYSGDGYCKRVVSQSSRRIPRKAWAKERRTMVCLPPESYAMIKKQFYKACYNSRCKQALDSVGELFQTLDDAVKAGSGILK